MLRNFPHIKLFALVLLVTAPLATLANTRLVPPSQNERLAVGAIKRLYDAEALYTKISNAVGNFGTLAELRAQGLIDDVMASGEKYGYVFTVSRVSASTSTPSRFYVYARPKVYRKTGIRSFYMSNTCLVSGADKGGAEAGPADPQIDQCTPTIAYEFDQKARIATSVFARAEFTYFSTVGSGGFGSHDQLLFAGFLMNPFGSYGAPSFGCSWAVSTFGGSKAPGFKVFATPLYYRENGIRSFFIDQTGTLRGMDRQGAVAHEDDPVIEDCPACSPSQNEATAIYVSQFLSGSESVFAFNHSGPGLGGGDYGTFQQLASTGLFDVPFNAGMFEGFDYTLGLTPAAPGVPPRFTFQATPHQYPVTGVRSFYIDDRGILRGADKGGAPAEVTDPPVSY